jgi:hypothetical protein
MAMSSRIVHGLVSQQSNEKEWSNMIIVAGFLKVEPNDRDRYVAEFSELVRRAREAPGCLDLAISADSIDPGRLSPRERRRAMRSRRRAFRGGVPAARRDLEVLNAGL